MKGFAELVLSIIANGILFSVLCFVVFCIEAIILMFVQAAIGVKPGPGAEWVGVVFSTIIISGYLTKRIKVRSRLFKKK